MRSVAAFFTLSRCTHENIGTVPCVPVVDDVLAALGFSKVGRYWVREDLDTIVGPPSSTPRDGCERVADEPEREQLFVELDRARRERYIASGKLQILGPRLWKWRIDIKD